MWQSCQDLDYLPLQKRWIHTIVDPYESYAAVLSRAVDVYTPLEICISLSLCGSLVTILTRCLCKRGGCIHTIVDPYESVIMRQSCQDIDSLPLQKRWMKQLLLQKECEIC